MPRTNQDGKDVKLVVAWLCRRNLPDTELAAALDMPTTTYNRRKDADDFPTFEELQKLADHFGLNRLALHIAFGYLDQGALSLLDDDGMRQYVEQGGGEAPFFPTRRVKTVAEAHTPPREKRRQRRPDASPL